MKTLGRDAKGEIVLTIRDFAPQTSGKHKPSSTCMHLPKNEGSLRYHSAPFVGFMNQVLQAPSVQGDGITSDARSHYRGRKRALGFFFSGSLQASQSKSGGSPSAHLIEPLRPLARFSERLHSSARGAALHRRCRLAPDQKPVSTAASASAGSIHRYLPGPREAGPAEMPPRRARDLPPPSPPGKLSLVVRKALWAAGGGSLASPPAGWGQRVRSLLLSLHSPNHGLPKEANIT